MCLKIHYVTFHAFEFFRDNDRYEIWPRQIVNNFNNC